MVRNSFHQLHHVKESFGLTQLLVVYVQKPFGKIVIEATGTRPINECLPRDQEFRLVSLLFKHK